MAEAVLPLDKIDVPPHKAYIKGELKKISALMKIGDALTGAIPGIPDVGAILQKEIEKIYNLLLSFTQKIIDEFPKTSVECDKSIKKMTENRLSYMKKLRKIEIYSTKLKTEENLLNDCRNFGTIPFSLMARIAFIGTAFLKSFVSQGYFSKKSIDKFMNSLDTPLSNFQDDLIKFYDNKITKKQFLEKYGHLRPGTYDITVDRYDKENPFLNDIKLHNVKVSKNNEVDFKYTKYFSK